MRPLPHSEGAMRKIDKLVFGSFVGPFVLTLVVVDFILLLVALLRYFDQIMGKGLSFSIFAELMVYFSISSSPDAFPLAVLLSSIMTFGNLGEHSELTAIKSSGISLVRVLAPIFVFVLFLTGFTYYSNTMLVPKINLKTYSLLWDMRSKKPALDIKEGAFYDGIPGYSIKVNKKTSDEDLREIIIYDHTVSKNGGNKAVIIADSGRMYSILEQRYLVLELYNGSRYEERSESSYKSKREGGKFVRDRFDKSKIVFDLSSFDMTNTDVRLFRRSRLVQTRGDLIIGVDSMKRDLLIQQTRLFRDYGNSFRYHLKESNLIPEDMLAEKDRYDSIRQSRLQLNIDSLSLPDPSKTTVELTQKRIGTEEDSIKAPIVLTADEKQDILKRVKAKRQSGFFVTSILNSAVNSTRSIKNTLNTRITAIAEVRRGKNKFLVTKNQQVARSFACLVMFLIGAPIGSIIKKGGLGLPVIVSLIFFLFYYIMNSTGEKWGKEGVLDPAIAIWISNAVLLPFGLFFLKKARNDAQLFETDFYRMWLDRVKAFFRKSKSDAQLESA